MFVQSANFVERHKGRVDNLSIYGQESNPNTWKLAQMNLAIHGLEGNLGQGAADTFFNDQHKNLKADFILANPPFNIKDWGGDKLTDDARWKYGTPPEGNANFAWIQHMISHLSPNGKIGLVLANGSLSSSSKEERKIRKAIIKDDLIETIISMPDKLFYSVSIPISLWIINKDKKQKRKTLFIDARNLGNMVTRAHRELSKEDINLIANTYRDFIKGREVDQQGFINVSDIKEIEDNDFVLTPGRYVGLEELEDDNISFEKRMEDLTSELSELLNESHRLEKEIIEQLGGIGFGI